MKKIKSAVLVCILTMGLATQASASDGHLQKQYNRWGHSSWWNNWVDKWYPGTDNSEKPDQPEESETPEIEIGTTKITQSKFTHQCPYYGMHPNLRISWEAVDNAEGYEIEVVKGDGTVNTYKATGASFYSEKVDCPRVYNEKTHTWESASVKVRAKTGDKVGKWSEVEKISCDIIH